MNFVNLRSLLKSLAFHAALIAGAIVFLWRTESPTVNSAIAPLAIVIEGRSQKSAPSRRKTPSIQSLGLFSKSGVPLRGSITPKTEDDEPESPFGFENQLSSHTNPILSHLFKRLDSGISYPPELRAAFISGEVTANLRFDDQGQWIDSVTDIHGSSNYLRVYVIHQLRHLLANPIPESLWKSDPHSFAIDTHFVFHIVPPETTSKQSMPRKQGFSGRYLRIDRIHYASSLEWQLGPISGYAIAPGIGIDPSWFTEKISNWIHHRDKVDPLQGYRDDPDW